MKNLKIFTKSSINLLFLFYTLQRGKRVLFLSIALLTIQTVVISQTKKVDYTISYDVETTEFKKGKKGETNYSDVEKFEFIKRVQELEHFDITVYDNGEEEVTISHIKSNRHPDWFTKPFKTIIDDKSVKTYDKNGKLLVDLEHSQVLKTSLLKMKQLNKDKKRYEVSKLERISQSDMSQLTAKGVLVKQTNDGKVHMKKENKEVLHDANNQEIEEREFDGKELKSLSKKRISTTRNNINYISQSTDITLEKKESNRKMYWFVNKSFSNYTVKQVLNARNNSENTMAINEKVEDEFSVSPNPSVDNLWVQIPANSENKSVDFFITDMIGKVVIRERLMSGTKQLNIKSLAAGIYIAQFNSTDGQRQSIRFVKN